jgi:hypothetical protein
MTVLYEVHLIVAPETGYLATLFEIAEHLKADPGYLSSTSGKLIRPRATMAVTKYGRHPEQAMLTYWCRLHEGDIISATNEVVASVTTKGLNVTRTKIEATTDSVPPVAKGDHYYEYHFKVQTKEWDRLAQACVSKGAHLFFNAFSKTGTMVPVITLRHYDRTRKESVALLNELMVSLSEHGFHADGEVQKEYSMLDSNVGLDEGWLFEGDPKAIICHVGAPED